MLLRSYFSLAAAVAATYVSLSSELVNGPNHFLNLFPVSLGKWVKDV